MQAQSPGFYFSMDLDDESRLINVFWANYHCRQAYKEFGDIVTFDTNISKISTTCFSPHLLVSIIMDNQHCLAVVWYRMKTQILLCSCSRHDFSVCMVKLHME